MANGIERPETLKGFLDDPRVAVFKSRPILIGRRLININMIIGKITDIGIRDIADVQTILIDGGNVMHWKNMPGKTSEQLQKT